MAAEIGETLSVLNFNDNHIALNGDSTSNLSPFVTDCKLYFEYNILIFKGLKTCKKTYKQQTLFLE